MQESTLETFDFSKGSHRQCRQCFMTGKACIYEQKIKLAVEAGQAGRIPSTPPGDGAPKSRSTAPTQRTTVVPPMDRSQTSTVDGRDAARVHAGGDRSGPTAFAILPFRPVMKEIYLTQLEPCLTKKLGPDSVVRADEVQRTGYIICEKICKQIQSSQLVAAEISSDNQNVFYELGLAYALGLPIVLFIQEDKAGTQDSTLQRLSIRQHISPYVPFKDVDPSKVKIWQRTIDRTRPPARTRKGDFPPVVGILADTSTMAESQGNAVFKYRVDDYCEMQIRLAIADAKEGKRGKSEVGQSAKVQIQERRRRSLPPPEADGELSFFHLDDKTEFETIKAAIEEAKCIILCTSKDDPLSYFWLGFAHGVEKTVIPITARPTREERSRDGYNQETDLPFDVRALWHIHFEKDSPESLRGSLTDILQMLLKDEDIAQRREFWRDILEEGRVSIFVGSVELPGSAAADGRQRAVRNVVGEWDYRTMAELCGFLVGLKETTEIVIQTPTLRTSSRGVGGVAKTSAPDAITPNASPLEDYSQKLANMLFASNAIVIGTPDSNDMTEIALAKLADKSAFYPQRRKVDDFCGIVATKREVGLEPFQATYYEFEPITNTPDVETRGFLDHFRGKADKRYVRPYGDHKKMHSKLSAPPDEFDGFTYYHGHVAKFSLRGFNPDEQEERWIIVIQGITGPATLGLAQILTGTHYRQFTIFDDDFASDRRLELLTSVASQEEPLRRLLEDKGLLTNETDRKSWKIAESALTPADQAETYKELLMSHSESMTRRLNEECDRHREQREHGVEAIVKLYVSDSGALFHDDRRLIWWDFEPGFPRVASWHPRHYT